MQVTSQNIRHSYWTSRFQHNLTMINRKTSKRPITAGHTDFTKIKRNCNVKTDSLAFRRFGELRWVVGVAEKSKVRDVLVWITWNRYTQSWRGQSQKSRCSERCHPPIYSITVTTKLTVNQLAYDLTRSRWGLRKYFGINYLKFTAHANYNEKSSNGWQKRELFWFLYGLQAWFCCDSVL